MGSERTASALSKAAFLSLLLHASLLVLPVTIPPGGNPLPPRERKPVPRALYLVQLAEVPPPPSSSVTTSRNSPAAKRALAGSPVAERTAVEYQRPLNPLPDPAVSPKPPSPVPAAAVSAAAVPDVAPSISTSGQAESERRLDPPSASTTAVLTAKQTPSFPIPSTMPFPTPSPASSSVSLPVSAVSPAHSEAPAKPSEAGSASPSPSPVNAGTASPPPPPTPIPPRISPGRTAARLIRHTAPHYPAEARREGQEGLVRLRLAVGTDGRVKTAEVVASSGFPLLDAAALAAVREWRYEPAREDGRPVAEERRVAVEFQLEDR